MQQAEINHTIAAIAEANHGLVPNVLARAQGITANQLSDRHQRGTLTRVDHGIYRVSGAPITWHQRLLTSVWAQGPHTAASHRSAAILHGLEPGSGPRPVEVIVPRWDRRTNRTNARLHESKDLLGSDITEVEGIPCTDIVRTLVDLPAVLPEFWADRMFEDAFRKKLCTVEEVTNRFVQIARRGRNGTRLGRLLLERRLGTYVPTMSEFELRAANLIEGADLPTLARQIPVRVDDGITVYIDLGWPDLRIGIECDGLAYHGGTRLPWDDDRQNQLVLRGWLIIRLTWEMLTKAPDHVLSQVRTARARHASAPSTLLA